MSIRQFFAVTAVASSAVLVVLMVFLSTAEPSINVAAAPLRPNEASASRGGERTSPVAVAQGVVAEEAATATTVPPVAPPAPKPIRGSQAGGASYYDFKPGGCAHKSLPKGTVVTVTNMSNGKSTICTVNDRGPFIAGRIIDLETRVFKQVASTSAGVFNARITW